MDFTIFLFFLFLLLTGTLFFTFFLILWTKLFLSEAGACSVGAFEHVGQGGHGGHSGGRGWQLSAGTTATGVGGAPVEHSTPGPLDKYVVVDKPPVS